MEGILDEHLARYHWNYGNGRGALGYRHLPSGVSVYRDCAPAVPVRGIDAELLIELQEELRSRGILSSETRTNQDPFEQGE